MFDKCNKGEPLHFNTTLHKDQNRLNIFLSCCLWIIVSSWQNPRLLHFSALILAPFKALFFFVAHNTWHTKTSPSRYYASHWLQFFSAFIDFRKWTTCLLWGTIVEMFRSWLQKSSMIKCLNWHVDEPHAENKVREAQQAVTATKTLMFH